MKIMFLLCRDGKYDEAAEAIGELIQYYDRYEPKSHYLYYEAGKLFSRVVRAATKYSVKTVTIYIFIIFMRNRVLQLYLTQRGIGPTVYT